MTIFPDVSFPIKLKKSLNQNKNRAMKYPWKSLRSSFLNQAKQKLKPLQNYPLIDTGRPSVTIIEFISNVTQRIPTVRILKYHWTFFFTIRVKARS